MTCWQRPLTSGAGTEDDVSPVYRRAVKLGYCVRSGLVSMQFNVPQVAFKYL